MTFQIETQSQIPSDSKPLTPTKAKSATETANDYLSILADKDLLITKIAPPDEGSLSFELDGAPFNVSHKLLNATDSEVIVWGTLGYLPFSVDSYENRRDIIKILHETCRLHKVRFGVDNEMKIIVLGKFLLKQPLTFDYFFEPIITFTQEARPYVRLIGDYL